VLWKMALASIKFSMYWPNTKFSDFSFRFSSFTVSTRRDRSTQHTHTQTAASHISSKGKGSPYSITGFQSWSRFLAVSLQVTWVINLAVGCHYFPPSPQLPSQPLRELLPISLLRSEPKPYCTWVQHANHSATEPPHRYIQILNIL